MLEVDKYKLLWDSKEYRQFSPAENHVTNFLRFAKPDSHHTITDFGCGTGRASLALSKFCKVKMLDFTDNSLDDEVRAAIGDGLEFVKHDLTQPITEPVTDFGICCDVLEHIPPEDVTKVLDNITKACKRLYLQISCVPDAMGALIGETLHLTVRPYSWWLEQLQDLGCVVFASKDYESACSFWLTRYVCGESAKFTSGLNTEEQAIADNITANLRLGLRDCEPFLPQEKELIILAGGPSLNDFEAEIRLNKSMGVPVVTVNGAYNWALERGIKPDVQVVLDAREFNKRFVEPVVDSCQYLICSQCHPSLAASLPKDNTYLWHTRNKAVADALRELGAERDVYPVLGGSTVMLRTLPLLNMLGYSRFCIYGWDSCLSDGIHHAYSQPENDTKAVLPVNIGGREFKCNPWMLTQAYEFLEMCEQYGDAWQLDVKGDGLIAHMIATSAKLDNLI